MLFWTNKAFQNTFKNPEIENESNAYKEFKKKRKSGRRGKPMRIY